MVVSRLQPQRQWAWIETETAMPIAAALADALADALQGRTTL